MKSVIKKIEDAAEIAQKLILELHGSDPGNVTFEQVGILDGREVVVDFINHGECGLALDHLLYMIHESDIRFPRETLLELHDIARSCGMKNHYSKENKVNLTREQRARIFNAP